jgi:hypothetical protein
MKVDDILDSGGPSTISSSMSHELVGFDAGELERYYYTQDPELRPVLDVLKDKTPDLRS